MGVACKSPSATDGSTAVPASDAVTDVSTETDAAGNTTTTSTAADGTITTTITSADGTSVTTVALPAEVDNLGSAGGIWRGVLTPDDKTKLARYYKTFISPSNRVVMLSDSESSVAIQGSDLLQSTDFSQTQDGITVNLKEYAKENDGTTATDVSIVGNLTPTDNIKGTYTRGSETGSVLFIYDPVYERGDRTPFFYTQNTYWKVSKTLSGGGTYSAAFRINDSFKMTGVDDGGMRFTFDEDGEVVNVSFPGLDSDSEACSYDGNFDIVDTHFFIYNVLLVVTDGKHLREARRDAARIEADTAQDVADTAQADADDAQVAADEAQVTADEAQAAADDALDDLSDAVNSGGDVEAAQAVADITQSIADTRAERAEELRVVADLEQTIADAAQLEANIASSAAVIAEGDWNEVQDKECDLAGVYTGLATLEEEYTVEDHPHTHYEFMTFGVSDGTRTINNRLTLDYFGV